MVTDDEYLERIVAGIHSLTTSGADVSWNEVINGRQFDVAVKFQLGTLRYLVLVEVKNRTRKATVSDMDAFVLKTRDQNANKAVFVTAAGFQSGAITVAKRHGVALFTVTFDEAEIELPSQASFLTLRSKGAPKGVPPSFSIGEPILVANIEEITLVYSDGNRFDMPTERSQMTYYVQRTATEDGRTLDALIQQIETGHVELGKSRCDEIRLDQPQYIKPPDDYFFPAGMLASLEFVVTGCQGRPISGNTLVEPTTFTSPVVYTNIISKEKISFAVDQLPLGVKRVSAGDFYFVPHPLMYYYCAGVEGRMVRWHLIESFQNGQIVRATMTQDISQSPHYIPVSDKKILKRLQRRLDDFLKLGGQKEQ